MSASHGKNPSQDSYLPERILLPRGDYHTLLGFQKAEVVANIALCLIHQANYLIDRQLLRLEVDFIKNGGLRERMTRIRLENRNKRQFSHNAYVSHKSPISYIGT